MNTIYCALILAAFHILGLLAVRHGKSPEKFQRKETLTNSVLKTLTVYLAAGLFCLLFLSMFVPSRAVTAGPWTLASARSHDSVQGNFVWGTGTVNGALAYHVYVKNGDGSITPYQIAGDSRVRIVEDSTLDGVGYWTQTTLVDDRSTAISRWAFASPRPDVVTDIEIRVPVGTVRQAFDIK